jgi:hypothetical protein
MRKTVKLLKALRYGYTVSILSIEGDDIGDSLFITLIVTHDEL